MTRITICLCAAMFVLACAPAAWAVPFSNGSFESPVITAPSYQVNSDSVWTLTSAQIMSSFVLNNSNNGNTTTDQGNQYGVLNISGSAGSIAQTFDTIAGGQYSVTFAQNQFYTNGGGSPPQPTSVNLTATAPGFSGNFVYNRGTVSDSSFVTDALWDHHTFIFTATGTSSTLTFNGNSTSGDNYGQAIDNVLVSFIPPPAPAPAPEPTSLVLLGLGALGLVLRRRRQRAA